MSEANGPTAINPMACVEVREFEDPESFVDFLRPSALNWGPLIDHACPWIYRGQSNADCRLIPSVWRKETEAKIAVVKAGITPAVEDAINRVAMAGPFDFPHKRVLQHMVQIAAETEMVIQFAKMADELGHPVPGWQDLSPAIPRLSFQDYRSTEAETPFALPGSPTFPGVRPNATFALAQHHGIPTRLLDWTRKPLFAAFFAAEGVLRDRQMGAESTRLAVWALSTAEQATMPMRLLTCPRHELAFLHAQDGLFTWLPAGDHHFVENGDWPSLEEAIAAHGSEPNTLRKIVLPTREAGALLRILWRERISRAHLMPTYDNVTQALLTKWAWWGSPGGLRG